jgi:prepilin signal peptidase PulO-like enzyme (type II secretory pathway)
MVLFLIIFIFGLIVGSFLNCVIYRLETKKSFLKGRSFCPNCKHALAWIDLVPLFSFIFLKRHCRYCKKSISWQYPVVEIATGLLFLLIFNFQFPIFNEFSIFNSSATSSLPNGFQFLNLIYYLLIASFLIIIFVYDLKHFIILDKVLVPAIVLSIFYRILEAIISGQLSVINYFCAALGAAGFFLLIYLISRGKWIGFADIKLAILLGLVVGWPNIIVSLFLSFLIGGIIGVGLVIFLGKKLKSEVPFAPFLIVGTLIALFWGQNLVNWYFSLIF